MVYALFGHSKITNPLNVAQKLIDSINEYAIKQKKPIFNIFNCKFSHNFLDI